MCFKTSKSKPDVRPVMESGDQRSETLIRLHRRQELRAGRAPSKGGLTLLDLALGAGIGELARYVVRRGIRTLFK